MKDLSETPFKEKLLVGRKAYVLVESIDPYDIQTGKLVQLDKFLPFIIALSLITLGFSLWSVF